MSAEIFLVGVEESVFIRIEISLVTYSMENCVFNNISNQLKDKMINLLPEVGVIEFGDNIFVVANEMIMYGVYIGDNCIIAANLGVTHDIPAESVIAGISAKVIGNFENRNNKFIDGNLKFELKKVFKVLYGINKRFFIGDRIALAINTNDKKYFEKYIFFIIQ